MELDPNRRHSRGDTDPDLAQLLDFRFPMDPTSHPPGQRYVFPPPLPPPPANIPVHPNLISFIDHNPPTFYHASSEGEPLPSSMTELPYRPRPVDEFDVGAPPRPACMNAPDPPSLTDMRQMKKRKPTPDEYFASFPPGNANLLFHNDAGELQTVPNLNLDAFADRAPLLAAAFDETRAGPQLYLEALTTRTLAPFLRFLYADTYAPDEGDAEVPTSVLMHCQLYQLGDLYDLAHLKTEAYVNVMKQCEYACSSPHMPLDLCAAIRFVYAHLAKHPDLIDVLINYCVACLEQHRLADDADFRALAYELRPFHQDMCRNTMRRGFENETATAIIQMPFETYKPATYASREDFVLAGSSRHHDDVYHFHATDEHDERDDHGRATPAVRINRHSKPRRSNLTALFGAVREPGPDDLVASKMSSLQLDPPPSPSSSAAAKAGPSGPSEPRRDSTSTTGMSDEAVIVQQASSVSPSPSSESEYEFVDVPDAVLSDWDDEEMGETMTLVNANATRHEALRAIDDDDDVATLVDGAFAREPSPSDDGRDSSSESEWSMVCDYPAPTVLDW